MFQIIIPLDDELTSFSPFDYYHNNTLKTPFMYFKDNYQTIFRIKYDKLLTTSIASIFRLTSNGQLLDYNNNHDNVDDDGNNTSFSSIKQPCKTCYNDKYDGENRSFCTKLCEIMFNRCNK